MPPCLCCLYDPADEPAKIGRIDGSHCSCDGRHEERSLLLASTIAIHTYSAELVRYTFYTRPKDGYLISGISTSTYSLVVIQLSGVLLRILVRYCNAVYYAKVVRVPVPASTSLFIFWYHWPLGHASTQYFSFWYTWDSRGLGHFVTSASSMLGTHEGSVISIYDTLGTCEDSVISAGGTLGAREDSVISASATLGTRYSKRTRTCVLMTESR